jgi:hypothetical protein
MSEVIALPAQAYIYVIGAPDGPQKIGLANDPVRRLAILQTGNASGIGVNASVPVMRSDADLVERHAHHLLLDRHIRGEWFDVTPAEALAVIRQAVSAANRGDQVNRIIGGRGRRKHEWEKLLVRFAPGTEARFNAVLVGKEDRATIIRELVDREIERRTKAARKADKT